MARHLPISCLVFPYSRVAPPRIDTAGKDSLRQAPRPLRPAATGRPDAEKASYYEAHDKGWEVHLASLQGYVAGQS